MDEHELRLLKMVVHAASQQAYHWLHPDMLQDACVLLQGLQLRGVAMQELSLNDWQELVLMMAALFKDVLPRSPLCKALRQSELLAQLLHNHVQSCARHEAEVVVWGDRLYPARLRTIPDPPLALTLLGNTSLLALPQVAIVGSRKASPRGLLESFALGRIVAQRGWVVISGGAYGCDIAAHRGCAVGCYCTSACNRGVRGWFYVSASNMATPRCSVTCVSEGHYLSASGFGIRLAVLAISLCATASLPVCRRP